MELIKKYKNQIIQGCLLISILIIAYWWVNKNNRSLEDQIINQQLLINEIRSEVIRNNDKQIEYIQEYLTQQKNNNQTYQENIEQINSNRNQRIQQIRSSQSNTEIINNFQRELSL